MIPYPDNINILEVSHLWHKHDPNNSNPLKLQIEVENTIRWIARSLIARSMKARNQCGEPLISESDLESFDEFMTPRLNAERQRAEVPGFSSSFFESIHEAAQHYRSQYIDYVNLQTQDFCQAMEILEQTDSQRIYYKDKLESIFISRGDLVELCEGSEISPPEFWAPSFEKSNDNLQTLKKLKDEQQDRLLVIGAAHALFHYHPEASISEIARHEIIAIKCNGNQYKERALRKWVSEAAPTKDHHKPGRRKNIGKSDS